MELLLALILFLVPLAYSPGPGNLFFAANGARFGFWATLPANAGYHLATWVITAAIGFGVIAAISATPQAFVALKLAGALYSLWLAVKMMRSVPMDDARGAKPATLLDGAGLLVLNPKAYLIITLMFTQFATSQTSWAWIIAITTVFTLNNLVAFSVWTLAGDRIGAAFRTPQRARAMNIVFGTMLAAVGLWMLWPGPL